MYHISFSEMLQADETVAFTLLQPDKSLRLTDIAFGVIAAHPILKCFMYSQVGTLKFFCNWIFFIKIRSLF